MPTQRPNAIETDKGKKLRFAPLNGDTANLVKEDFPEPWPDSLGFYTASKLYFKSKAVAKALRSIGGPQLWQRMQFILRLHFWQTGSMIL